MELSQTQTRWLGRATWWPPIYMLLFFGFMVLWTLGIFGSAGAGALVGQANEELAGLVMGGIMLVMLGGFGLVFLLHILTMVWILAQLAFYIVHVVQNPTLDSNTRLLWGVVVIFAGFIGQLIYYYQVIRSPPALDVSSDSS